MKGDAFRNEGDNSRFNFNDHIKTDTYDSEFIPPDNKTEQSRAAYLTQRYLQQTALPGCL